MAHFAGVSSKVPGDATISFLADGGGRTKPTASFPASDDEGWARHRDALSDSGELVTSIGGFLIELPERKIVVDTDIGPVEIDFPSFGPFSGGAFLGSLASTGVDPADVMDVVFTHLHLDHVGWTTTKRDGNRGEGVLRDLEHPDTTAAVGHFADNVFGHVVWEDGARPWRSF